jgi:hypothetical protein
MPLDFNLLRQSGPTNLYEGFTQGQEKQQANAMAQQKMAQDQEVNALRRQQLTGQIQEQEDTRRKQTVAQKTAMFRERLLRARDPNSARELVKMQYADPDVGAVLSQGGTLEQALAEVPDDPVQFRTYLDQEAMGMADWIKSQTPKVTPTGDVYDPANRSFIRKPQAAPAPREVTPPVSVAEYNLAQQDPNFMRFLQQRAAATRAPVSGGGGGAMPKAPAGYRYTLAGDLEAIPGGPAAAGPNLTPKDIQKREAVLPQARQAVSTVSNTMSIIGETVDRLIANKSGLNGVTGLVSGRTPGITDAARKAEADLNQLKNLAFIQGITELRAASKTGAGVGNVSNKEGDRFENLKASLERTQSYDDIVAALKRLKSQSEFTKQSLQEAFDETYSYRNAAPDASNAAQERANANAAIAAGAPAAAVRQRFKEKTGQEL